MRRRMNRWKGTYIVTSFSSIANPINPSSSPSSSSSKNDRSSDWVSCRCAIEFRNLDTSIYQPLSWIARLPQSSASSFRLTWYWAFGERGFHLPCTSISISSSIASSRVKGWVYFGINSFWDIVEQILVARFFVVESWVSFRLSDWKNDGYQLLQCLIWRGFPFRTMTSWRASLGSFVTL